MAEFSPAEREIAVKIRNKHGGVTDPCHEEVKAALGRYVSKEMIRRWYNASLIVPSKPRSHHAKRAEDSADNAPRFDQLEATEPTSAKPDDLAGLSFVEKIEKLLDRLTDRSLAPEQIELISGPQLPKTISGLIDSWLKLRHLDPIVLELAPFITEFASVCEFYGVLPRQTLIDMTEYIKGQAAARNELAAQDNHTGEQVFLSQTIEAVAE